MSKFLRTLALAATGLSILSMVSLSNAWAFQEHKRNIPSSLATKKIPYYGGDFFKTVGSTTKAVNLKTELNEILNGVHVKNGTDMDIIAEKCGSSSGCYFHKAIGYKAARTVLLGKMYLVNIGKSYAVKDVYCEKEYTSDDFSGGPAPGPNVIPDNNVINIEHTWPQSKFNTAIDKETQKSDLHHLFPTDSKMNSLRGNFPFGEVVRVTKETNCDSGASFGEPAHGPGPVFEPPAVHKGNVARAIFYFSTKYEMDLDPYQESTLKKWHDEDPVDQDEALRNEEIYELQGSRNPFIDYPDLVNRIPNF